MISLPQVQFRKAALFAASVLSRRQTIPVLSTIKVSANGALSMEGTDLDTYVRATIPYEGDEGVFLIAEPRKVSSAVKHAGAETVSFDMRDRNLHMEAGELTADLGSPIPADDFPASGLVSQELFSATVGEDFFRLLDRVRPAISTEETRYYLNGIYAHKVGDWLYRLVATDGHRLFIADMPLPDATGEMPDGVIIPRRAVEHAIETFAKAPAGARFTLGAAVRTNTPDRTLAPTSNASRAGFSAEIGGIRFELATKLIDGTYPDYRRVVPADHSYSVRVQKADLLKAIKSLTPLSTGKTRAIRLKAVKDGLTAELHSPDMGKSRFPVAAEHNAPEGFEIGMNARYLLDALRAFGGEEIVLGLSDSAAPVTITDPSDTTFKVVQMPMRV